MERTLRLQDVARQTHSLRAAAHRLAVKAAPYETRAFLLWATTAAGFAGTTAIRRCPASAHLWSWVYVVVIALTLIALLLDRQAWEEHDGLEEDRAGGGWARAADHVAPVPALVLAHEDASDPPGQAVTVERET